MKRPPGIWLLLATVFVWMCIEEVYSLKATSLIFAKTTTTTKAPDSESVATDEATSTESSPAGDQNSTKPALTGIPQIDYIYDPNLPRELNGYNLSEYPFYDRVPEDIDFKCDGLHDGFYASEVHKCQVYHHCLFGTRFDFLCANYTAFDQTTFICHFVSEVDCVNSKKYWHRNDALYQAASTTTVKPITINTPPTVPPTSVPIVPILSRRKPPARRRRPQYDYYEDGEEDDDYYEEPRRRPRPRYRPRPVYDDDYEYEEEAYDRGRRRDEDRRYNRRGSHDRRYDDRRTTNRRNKDDRRKEDDDDYEADYVRPANERRTTDERRERRPSKRRPEVEDDYDRGSTPRKSNRRPLDDDYEEDKGSKNDRRPSDRPRKNNEDDDRRSDRPRKRVEDEDQDRKVDRPRKKNEDEDSKRFERPADKKLERPRAGNVDDKPLTKPPSSVYDRARPSPRIRPPVPKTEKTKYTYKAVTTKSPPVDEEYYDDYEEDAKTKPESETTRRPLKSNDESKTQTKHSTRRGPSHKQREDEYEDEIVTRRSNKEPKFDEASGRRASSSSRKRPVVEEYEYDDEDKSSNANVNKNENKRTSTVAPTTKEPRERAEPVVKVVKRPFLPSRGGSPYTSRGLQPVGTKALESNRNGSNINSKLENIEDIEDKLVEKEEALKPAPVVIKTPTIAKYNAADEVFRPLNRPLNRQQQTTTQKSNIIKANPLDIDESEYDVTLNDALNPTLPNLPIRGFPTGFSNSADYFNTLQRSRYVADPSLNQASSNYVYRVEQPVQKLDQGYNVRNPFVTADSLRYNLPNTPIYQNYKQSSRPTLAQTQAFYHTY